MILALLFLAEIRTWLNAFLAVIGDYVRNAFIFVLVVVEFISETRLFARLRTVCIFGAAFTLFTAIAILLGKAPEEKPDIGLSVHQFCRKYGYTIQNETVKTEDGYILTMHRIKCPRNKVACEAKRPPVLLLHGFLGSSADFVTARNQSLAFQLADKGYDVWLGNSRGNTHSRDHFILDPNEDSHFWDFSFHEIGLSDLPAMIDHVISQTNFSRLTYVGMSQGSAAYLAMSSLKPEYNEKVILANLLAPVTASSGTKTWSVINFFIEWALYYIGPCEIFGDNNIETTFLRYFCLGPHKIANHICIEHFLTHGIGLSDQKNYDLFPFHVSVSPAGASLKQVQHFIQNRNSGKFAQYDYYDRNQDIYQQDYAPIYNISKITAPVAFYFGRGDLFVSVEGLYQQLKLLPNVVLCYKVPYNKFNHMDFIVAKDLNVLLNNKLMETIDIYNRNAQKSI